MMIAVTRVPGKEGGDRELCARYGHVCTAVSPLRMEVHRDRVDTFLRAANRGEYDAIFFASAVPAQLIGPGLRGAVDRGPGLTTRPRVIAIGPQTARVLRDAGVDCEVLPTFYSRDLVPFLGEWVQGKRIGIPRADVENEPMIRAIRDAGGIPCEVRCYALIPTGTALPLGDAEALLFTSASSYRHARWDRREGLFLMAIGEITAGAMRGGGDPPQVVGDGSLEGTLRILNTFLAGREAR
ncbi:MAG: uroporphyrinogen-III synthase [Methanomicrobiales archaeon]|nr:uroporphyrinogen-III synthase [Methanomicrobiales archaeon]